MDSQQIYCF